MNDQITSANRDSVAAAAFRVIDRVQNSNQNVQIAGAAVAFVLMAERMGINPGDLYALADRIMRDDNAGFGRAKQFAAVADYLKNELKS